ncbi:MAG: ROK family glucokinase [Clostridium sp.]|jgi:glucokinase|nr:ROK family glucokinase [Clostridium sp.]HAE80445.1 glucokinase [Lachnoclostridium sp.]
MAKEKCCFGVDVGGTTVKIGCFDKEGHLISKWEIPTRKESQGKYILPDVAESLKERMEMDGIELENVQGIGIGVPGPVLANGTVERCVNLGWGHTDMKGILRQYFPGVDIEAGNDANVAALGEVWRGAGRGKKNAVMVTLGTGVGGGVVIDGKIVSGVHGMGGEIGHIHIRDEDQDTCNCGGHGCLEQTASATGLVREAKRLLQAAPEKTSSMLEYGEKLEAKDIVACAVQGDELALKAIDTMSFYLGRALASIAMVVDPEVFIIGGGVSRAGKFLNDKIEKYYYEYAPLTGSKSEIVTALLGNDAGIYGAAKMVLD